MNYSCVDDLKKIKLTDDQERKFKRYAVFYDLAQSDYECCNINENNAKDWSRVMRQKEVYFLILQSEDNKNDGMLRLIDLTNKEIEYQYLRKGQIENRTGFLMAYLGILVGIFFNSNGPRVIVSATRFGIFIEWKFIIIVLAFIAGAFALCFVWLAIRPYEMKRLAIDTERDNNLQCSAEDPVLLDIRFIESLTNVWIKNELIIVNHTKYFNWSVNATIIFSVFVAIVLFLN